MNKSDIKIGMKVVPHDKTYYKKYHSYYENLDSSVVWKNAKLINQNYLYVTKICDVYCILSLYKDSDGGDHFLFSDFTNPTLERKNKLLKIYEQV